MSYMDGPLEPGWVNDREWEEEDWLDCETEDVDGHPEGVECNEHCDPASNSHVCGFSGEVMFSCVGQTSYTAYYECPWCGSDGYKEKENGDW